MRRLIVNADDLGYDRVVNEDIFRFIEAGSVTSATILTNGPAVEAAVARLQDFPRASFGVHLNVTEFPPLTRGAVLDALCDESGALATGWVKKLALSGATRDAVFQEWCAQVERALDLRVPVSHLDSHHHVHTHPALFAVFKRVQLRFNIRKARLRRNIFNIGRRRPAIRAATTAWNAAFTTIVPTQTTNAFTEFATLYERVVAGCPWTGTVELMCHPGSPLFTDETRLLEGDWRGVLGRDVTMISYLDL
ncbi:MULTISPECIES: carbohydrate deacetylase [unclassified Bradyrhizobium]|uniref:carbohydrate deacetylase n=1 Tax=unclassified Bradyrhizobium TaxID=2631580 RepID=UPI0020B26ED0|nr:MULTISPECIES: ChbG/HpnK family deacetylase [unclassified Bradyrhizobium]MCP3384055.1 ChbG/HpnK family deacetylase [Bradyrhizobium sp. CCGUVB4N]MCP3445140.1 ChbG/HpnK family deacetylase [Bradyrhizobium sp. CCGUVB14]